jgi:hypothetical protein
MRLLVALASLLALTACDASTGSGNASAGGGYTLEIRASTDAQTYIVVTPEGATVGARSAEGASALMDADRARALFDDPPPQGETPQLVSVNIAGFNMSIGGSEGEDGEQDRVNLSFGGDNQRVEIYADEGGPGEADDRAYVRISGADEDAVRGFIADAEDLSPEVRAQMLAALGLRPSAEPAP